MKKGNDIKTLMWLSAPQTFLCMETASGVCDRGDFVKMYTTIAAWKSNIFLIFILNIHFLPSYCWVTYVAADSCLLVPQQQNVCVCLLWLLEPKTHHLIALITYGFLTFTEALPSVTAGYDSLTKWQHQSTFPRLSHSCRKLSQQQYLPRERNAWSFFNHSHWISVLDLQHLHGIKLLFMIEWNKINKHIYHKIIRVQLN